MEMLKNLAIKFWTNLWDDKLYKHEVAIIFVGGLILGKIF